MRKALIHDWFDLYGGAERVITAISEIYDFDYYYAYVNKMSRVDLKRTFAGKEIKVIESNILGKCKRFFRYLLPFFPYIARSFNRQTKANKVDLVISSSWVLSKSYRIGDETHICYIHCRNFKYVWDEAFLYFKGPLKLFSFIKKPLRAFDIRSAQVPDHLITNSKFVQRWVKEKYDRESTVIYPPVEVDDFYISEEKSDYYVTVGRIVRSKRFEIIVDAFSQNGKKLIVVGDGQERKSIQKRAAENVSFVGFKTKDELKELLAYAKAFVFAAAEDFGIAIVEALAAGLPVIAYKGGASGELVSDETGVLYDSQDAETLNQSIRKFEEKEAVFNPHIIRESALKFSKERFQREFSAFVENVKPK